MIARLLVIALSFLLAAYLVPGIHVDSFYIALVLAFFWGIIHFVIRPILLLLTFPINVVTLGLFTFVVNGFLFWMLGTFVKGFQVAGFWEAILGAFVVTFASWLGNRVLKATDAHH